MMLHAPLLHGPSYHDHAKVSDRPTTPSPLPLQLNPSQHILHNYVMFNNQLSASPPYHHFAATTLAAASPQHAAVSPQHIAATPLAAVSPQHAAVVPLQVSPTRIAPETPQSTQSNNITYFTKFGRSSN